MFPINSETKQEGGYLRSGRIFQSRKRIRTTPRRASCSATEERDYELVLHLNGESCDREEEFKPIGNLR